MIMYIFESWRGEQQEGEQRLLGCHKYAEVDFVLEKGIFMRGPRMDCCFMWDMDRFHIEISFRIFK